MKWNSGFTLIELSVVLALIGVILYGSMSLLVVGVQTAQVNSTVATMDAIEKALLDFRVAFGRIPCPADITLTTSSANYGMEAANTGSCTGGSPAANLIAASGTAEGGVPTRALRLPDSYMYDGWGHKLRYAVNPNYTVTTSTACSLGTNPAITVNDASGAARSTKAIYAIVSHGANGHGAYTSNGVVVNAGNTNADELTNCHCTSTGAADTYSSTYVQKVPTIATAGSLNTAFDDIVAYKEFWQLMTPNLTTNSLGCLFSGYYRTVTIDHTKVGTVNNTDQSSFPVLFSGTYTYLKTVANGGLVQNANGYDITFTSDAAGTHLLPFERESYNATTGAVVFWVQVPTVSHSTDTVIYLQYDNPNIITDQSSQHGTWNSNYAAVWHLKESGNGTSGEFKDSTTNANNGTGGEGNPSNTPTQSTGIIGNGQNFNGSDDILVSTLTGVPNTNAAQTFMLWYKVTSNPSAKSDIISISGGSSNQNVLAFDGSGNIGVYQCFGGTTIATAVPTANAWHQIAWTWDGTTDTLYVDGSQKTTSTNTLQSGAATAIYFGTWENIGNGAETLTGYLDEVEVSSGARSADWVKTEYNSQSAPDKATYGASGFYTVGAQTSR